MKNNTQEPIGLLPRILSLDIPGSLLLQAQIARLEKLRAQQFSRGKIERRLSQTAKW